MARTRQAGKKKAAWRGPGKTPVKLTVNGRVQEVLLTTRVDSSQNQEETLTRGPVIIPALDPAGRVWPHHALQYWPKNDRNCLISAFIIRRNLIFLNSKPCEKYVGAAAR